MSSPSERSGHSGRGERAAQLALALALLAGSAACSDEAAGGGEPPPDPNSQKCQDSALSYQNFAAPFMITWCRGCHGAGQPVAMRQDAPAGVDFDTAEPVRATSARILVRATGELPTMPPVGGPSDEERALLAEWLACGRK